MTFPQKQRNKDTFIGYDNTKTEHFSSGPKYVGFTVNLIVQVLMQTVPLPLYFNLVKGHFKGLEE